MHCNAFFARRLRASYEKVSKEQEDSGAFGSIVNLCALGAGVGTVVR